jgi:hypothetical protein
VNDAIDERLTLGCRRQGWSLAQAVRRVGPRWSNHSNKWNADFHSIALWPVARKDYQIKQARLGSSTQKLGALRSQ